MRPAYDTRANIVPGTTLQTTLPRENQPLGIDSYAVALMATG